MPNENWLSLPPLNFPPRCTACLHQLPGSQFLSVTGRRLNLVWVLFHMPWAGVFSSSSPLCHSLLGDCAVCSAAWPRTLWVCVTLGLTGGSMCQFLQLGFKEKLGKRADRSSVLTTSWLTDPGQISPPHIPASFLVKSGFTVTPAPKYTAWMKCNKAHKVALSSKVQKYML